MKNGNDAVDGSSTRHLSATDVGAGKAPHDLEELPMQTVTTIDLDIAKSVFHVHAVDATGEVVLGGQIKRRLLTFFRYRSRYIEACVSAHPAEDEQVTGTR
jgi:hypothetical protein